MQRLSILRRVFSSFILLLLLTSISVVGHAREWAGLYHGKISGQPSQLTLNRAGNDIIGVLDTEGYRYKLEGNIQQGKLIGFCRDIKSGETGQLSASVTKDVIIIRVVLPGYHRPARLVFERADDTSSIFTKMASL
ncbi:hypothetical protein [Litoribacillus peritrichatus]|uniref:Uncharacterized protein n=1 Tax=Litoribacillus peritrichatus TaxID=718191 RepID=A0ABP7MBV9_9GAMM